MMTPDERKAAALKIIAEAPVKPGQVWRHTRTGNTYYVTAVGMEEWSLNLVVVYQGSDFVTWVRRLDEFLGQKDGTARFTRVLPQGVLA